MCDYNVTELPLNNSNGKLIEEKASVCVYTYIPKNTIIYVIHENNTSNQIMIIIHSNI